MHKVWRDMPHEQTFATGETSHSNTDDKDTNLGKNKQVHANYYFRFLSVSVQPIFLPLLHFAPGCFLTLSCSFSDTLLVRSSPPLPLYRWRTFFTSFLTFQQLLFRPHTRGLASNKWYVPCFTSLFKLLCCTEPSHMIVVSLGKYNG